MEYNNQRSKATIETDEKGEFREPLIYVLLPILVMSLIAPFTPVWDLAISHYFYDEGGHFLSNGFLDFMFNYAVIPAELAGIIAFIIYCLSFCVSTLKVWRTHALALILTMLLGAGFITHTLLKDNWGRPRPKQVIEFNGNQPFRPFYSPNFYDQPQPSKSFPCGHCTMGFYFFALALVFRRLRYRKLFYFTAAFAVIFGMLLGISRIAQGGHFLSDVLVAGIIMWVTAYLCDYYLSNSS